MLAVAADAAPRKVVSFRLKKDPAHRARVYCLAATDVGMEIEYLGTRRKTFVRWDDIVEPDAKRLRVHFELELSEDEKKGLIAGHEVSFEGGALVRGIVERRDEKAGKLFIRTDGMILAYPLPRVEQIEETKIRESEAFSEDEIYIRRLRQRPPEDWVGHRRLADHLYEIGHYRGAQRHYQEAVRLHAPLGDRLSARLADIEAILEDKDALAVIRKAKSLAHLQGRYADAARLLEQFAEQRPGSRRRIVRILDELEAVRVRKLTVRYHRVKAREADRAIRSFLTRQAPTLEEARAWITGEFREELQRRIARRMELEPAELDGLSKTRAKGAAHWASYGGGSFVLSPTAKRGVSSRQQGVRGDPESWWRRFGDGQSRSTWLKAYAAEQLPELFEVVRIHETDCVRCGGRGVIVKGAFRSSKASGGRSQWKENCPRCFGARVDRGIGYR
ncbi:MAG: hypothetical protein AAGD14_05025 [Planctomycetota bacterium]